MDDDDALLWMMRQKLRSAVRVLVAGALITLAGVAINAVAVVASPEVAASLIRLRVAGGLAAVVGVALIVAGMVLIRAARRELRAITPEFPAAVARARGRSSRPATH